MLHLLYKLPHLRLLEAHIHSTREADFRQKPVNFVNCRLNPGNGLVASGDAASQQFAAEDIVLALVLKLAQGDRHSFQVKAKLSDRVRSISARIIEPFELLRALQKLHRQRHQAGSAGDSAEYFCHCGRLSEIVIVRRKELECGAY
jgi:hypothetical protein